MSLKIGLRLVGSLALFFAMAFILVATTAQAGQGLQSPEQHIVAPLVEQLQPLDANPVQPVTYMGEHAMTAGCRCRLFCICGDTMTMTASTSAQKAEVTSQKFVMTKRTDVPNVGYVLLVYYDWIC